MDWKISFAERAWAIPEPPTFAGHNRPDSSVAKPNQNMPRPNFSKSHKVEASTSRHENPDA